MNQPVPNELISAYFDGEVTPEERGQVEHLLESSTELRQSLDETSKLSALLHSFPRETPPVELLANVQQRVDSIAVNVPAVLPARKSLKREWTAFGAGIMATMASLFCFYVFSNQFNVGGAPRHLASRPTATHEFDLHAANVVEQESAVADTQFGGIRALELKKAQMKDASKDSMLSHDHVAMGVMSAAPAGNLPVPEADMQTRDLTTNVLSDGIIVEAPELVDFLRDLPKGKVFVRQMVDPNNSVAIVEFTVVDIYKGAEEMQLLLQKRNLPEVENMETSPSSDRVGEKVAMRSRLAVKRASAPDDLLVIFVRAPGEQLVDLINDSQNNHPDIYKKLEPQLPIQLSNNFVDNSLNVSNNGVAAATAEETPNSSVAVAEKNAVVEPQVATPPTVAVEANLAVNLYANMNDYQREDSLEVSGSPRKMLSTAPRPAAVLENARGDSSASKAEDAKLMAKQDGLKEVKSKEAKAGEAKDAADKQSPENSKTSGYATFQLAHANQRPFARQQSASVSGRNSVAANSTVAASPSNQISLFNNGQTMNNSTPNFGYSPLPGQVNLRRAARGNNDNRDQQLVRMLIVLRNEQSNPANVP